MLNSKVSEAQSIYVNEIRQVQQTAEKWKNFLEFSAQARISETQSEYEFSSKLIIHAHNPNATDCRQFGEWKTSDGNHVNFREKGIPVLFRDRNGNQSVTYLFDTSQTALPKEPERIVIPEEHKESFKSALSSMIDRISDNASFSDEQKRFFRETAEYKLCKQYGLTTNENSERFSGIEKMSVKDVANIGIALNRCSKEFSSIIERNDFNDYERVDSNKSGKDRTELHGREPRGMDLGGGIQGTRQEIRVRQKSEPVVQAQQGERDIRTADRDTLSEANGSNGQVRQHETEIHMENSMPDRNDNAERGNEYNQALRGNERTSSEPDRRNNGEEKAVGGVQEDSEIGQIHSDGAVTGEVQSGSGGRNTSRDGLRNITNETAEPDMVSAVSDLSDNEKSFESEIKDFYESIADIEDVYVRAEKFRNHLIENNNDISHGFFQESKDFVNSILLNETSADKEFVNALSELSDKLKEAVHQSVQKSDQLEFHFGKGKDDTWISESDLMCDFALAHPDCSFALGNAIFEYLDEKQHTERSVNGLNAGWYKKTDFEITAVIGGEDFHYEGRFDIGDGKGTGGGSLIDHIRDFNQSIIDYTGYPYNTPKAKEQAKNTLDILIPFLEKMRY